MPEAQAEYRKPVTSFVIPETDDREGARYVVCDDGSVWVGANWGNEFYWLETRPIPGTKRAEEDGDDGEPKSEKLMY